MQDPTTIATELSSCCQGFLDGRLNEQKFKEWVSHWSTKLLRPSLDGQANAVPERDIRRCLSRFGTDQAVINFCNEHKIILPQEEFWYCMNPLGRTAWVDGLEASQRCHGIPRITNGVVCYVELGSGELVLCHRDYLKYDRRKADLTKPTAKASVDILSELDKRLLDIL